MNLFVAGLSYKTAPVEIREKLAVHASRLRCHGCRLKLAGNLEEVVVVSTCNRVEIYGVSSWAKGRAYQLFQTLATEPIDFAPYLYVKEGAAAVDHLFRVSAGLDSMVIGETEITGQIKQAYQAAQAAGLTGKVTNRLFQTALQTAKAIRTQTAIGRGATSVGSVAVELAERIFDQAFADKTVMIVGAGKMGEACVRHLAKKGARSVIVANRSPERARLLAEEFGGRAVSMDECWEAMAATDIVVSSTGSPNIVLTRDQIARVMVARRNRPLFLIDIAVPRDIDPEVQNLENVYLYNVDHLEQIVQENVRSREKELTRCEQMIAENAAAFLARFRPAEGQSGQTTENPGWLASPAHA